MDTRARHRRAVPPHHPAPRRPREPRGGAGRPALAAGLAPLRLPIPAAIVAMVERGLALPEAGARTAGWWRWVERRMHRFVFGRLPAGAGPVTLALDAARLEVVVGFAARAPRSRARP